jgi:hypothetical protein
MGTDYLQSGIHASVLSQSATKLLNGVKSLIKQGFSEHLGLDAFSNDGAGFREVDKQNYFDVVSGIQAKINESDFVERFVICELRRIRSVLGVADISLQKIAYLRATRPLGLESETETVGFHRESFFGAQHKPAFNIWIPLVSIDKTNAMRFIPGSQSIADDEIKRKNAGERSSDVARYSSGHKIGLSYNPIEIVSGVDLQSAMPLLMLDGEYAIFDGNLIHGAGQNFGQCIRFSLDFRCVPFGSGEMGYDNFAAGGEYYRHFDPANSGARRLVTGKSS